MSPETLHTIGQIIQLSVAPVFLLMALGSFINVATTRLGRVVDRARVLENFLDSLSEETQQSQQRARYIEELGILNKRMVSINLSITFATFAALLVCFVVALLFMSDLMNFNALVQVSLLFVATMAMLVIALLFFLSEILIARASLKVHSRYLKTD